MAAPSEKLDFADGHFDAVVSNLMRHHLPRPLQVPALRETRRVLKPEARCSSRFSAARVLATIPRHRGMAKNVPYVVAAKPGPASSDEEGTRHA
jgi:ubiquinone/menaquinone biosynthesis C-methylase UbiE